jgi:hypothetical protein
MQKLWASMAAVVLGMVAAVSFATPALAYSPGTARAYPPTYNAITGQWDYHCSFSGWRSGAKVTWQCNLWEQWYGELGWEKGVRQKHSGSWTPGSTSYTTSTFGFNMQVGQGSMCTEAYALSVDGGVSKWYCQ